MPPNYIKLKAPGPCSMDLHIMDLHIGLLHGLRREAFTEQKYPFYQGGVKKLEFEKITFKRVELQDLGASALRSCSAPWWRFVLLPPSVDEGELEKGLEDDRPTCLQISCNSSIPLKRVYAAVIGSLYYMQGGNIV